MNNRTFCLVTMLMMLCLNVSYAAFPVKQQAKPQALQIEGNSIILPDLRSSAVGPAQVAGKNPSDAVGFSIAALACGLVGFFVAGIPLGVCAIVFGGIGVNRKLRGLAIAGVVLGAIDIIGAIIVISQQP